MASISWSNPNPGATAAALGNAAHVDSSSNIGALVAAIMQMRARKEAQQREDMNNIVNSVAKGVSMYQQNAQQGAANDAANAAIYASQYPNDPYGGFSDPNRVPDYGGTDSLRALASTKAMNPEAFMTPEQKEMEQARLDEIRAHADYFRSGGRSGVGGMTAGQQAVQERFNTRRYDALIKRQQQLEDLSEKEKQDNMSINKPDVHFSKENELNKINEQIAAMEGAMTNTFGVSQNDVDQASQDYDHTIPGVNEGATPAPANTGMAPSREEAQSDGYYRAPDGSVLPSNLPPPSGGQEHSPIIKAASDLVRKIKDAPIKSPTPSSTPPASPMPTPVQVQSVEDYNRVPRGQPYIDPNGVRRIKS